MWDDIIDFIATFLFAADFPRRKKRDEEAIKENNEKV